MSNSVMGIGKSNADDTNPPGGPIPIPNPGRAFYARWPGHRRVAQLFCGRARFGP